MTILKHVLDICVALCCSVGGQEISESEKGEKVRKKISFFRFHNDMWVRFCSWFFLLKLRCYSFSLGASAMQTVFWNRFSTFPSRRSLGEWARSLRGNTLSCLKKGADDHFFGAVWKFCWFLKWTWSKISSSMKIGPSRAERTDMMPSKSENENRFLAKNSVEVIKFLVEKKGRLS